MNTKFKIKRAGAALVSAFMLAGVMAPTYTAVFAEEVSETAETAVVREVNYALGAKVSANDKETDDYGPEKAVDGIVNRDAPKPQSRWATHTSAQQEEKVLTVDLGESCTFSHLKIEWERTNIKNFKIEVSDKANEGYQAVYTKTDDQNISSLTSDIHLETPASGRYVRLTVSAYDKNPGDWQSVSVYEFEVLGEAENLSLTAKATADGSEDNNTSAVKANDGDDTTRWASIAEKSPHWLQLTYQKPDTISSVKIHWERKNAKNYMLQTSGNGTEWTTIKEFTSKPEDWTQVINLDTPVTTQYLRLLVKDFDENGAVEGHDPVSWPTVSVYEFETYRDKLPEASAPQPSAKDTADNLEIPAITGDTLAMPAVDDGYTISFIGADFEEILDDDLHIHKPLTDKAVSMNFHVTRESDQTEADSKAYSLTIPGRYTDAGVNPKPVVVPELAEWYGGTEAGDFSFTGKIAVAEDAQAFLPAAQALAEDIKSETGKTIDVVTGNGENGDIVFVNADPSEALGEEGYSMQISAKTTVAAEQEAGAYWATRTILQILEQNEWERMPKGETRDYPKYPVRGFMLDVARKPISMETLQSVAKEMSYYKMNDLHLHLNDNLIFYEDFNSAEEARDNAYTGFRLESDIKKGGNGGKNKSDLTNKDMSYSKKDFRQFILDFREMGVNITPEFDAPGHSGAFTKVRPDLMLDHVVSGQPNRAGEQFNLAEEKYQDSLNFVQSVWNEYLNEDMFDKSMTVHIGTDEYYGEKNRFRVFTNDMIHFLKEKGYTVRMWGSLSNMGGSQPVDGEGVELNIWNTGYANPAAMYKDGYKLINSIDGSVYIVPAAGYYNDYLNKQNLYNNWEPNNFGGTVIPAGSDQMLGSAYAIWNDSIDTRANGISELDIYDRFQDALPALASKNWGKGAMTFEQLESTVNDLGDAPGINPYSKASHDQNDTYMTYAFEEDHAKTDSSLNNRDLGNEKNVSFVNDALTLQGGASYVETPLKTLGVGNELTFDVTLNEASEAGQILFEADHEGNEDYVHDIRIMDDGRVGFRREMYDYYFDYKLPVGQKVTLTISTQFNKTVLKVNDREYPAVGVYRNRQVEGAPVRKEGVSLSTFELPLQRIGSKINAIHGVIDNVNVTVFHAPEVVDEYNKTQWTGEANTETNHDDHEGLFAYAFDGDLDTRWHSNWKNGASDKVTNANGKAGNMDKITGTVNLNAVYNVNRIYFTPRKDANSGYILKANAYVHNADTQQWESVGNDLTFANNGEKKEIKFAARNIDAFKIEATQSNDGWVAVAEFDIDYLEPRQLTVSTAVTGKGSVSGAGAYAEDTDVTVHAIADQGEKFVGWYDQFTNEKLSDKADYTFTVQDNTALVAKFGDASAKPTPLPTEKPQKPVDPSPSPTSAPEGGTPSEQPFTKPEGGKPSAGETQTTKPSDGNRPETGDTRSAMPWAFVLAGALAAGFVVKKH